MFWATWAHFVGLPKVPVKVPVKNTAFPQCYLITGLSQFKMQQNTTSTDIF